MVLNAIFNNISVILWQLIHPHLTSRQLGYKGKKVIAQKKVNSPTFYEKITFTG
jgi:hypothetical protein